MFALVEKVEILQAVTMAVVMVAVLMAVAVVLPISQKEQVY